VSRFILFSSIFYSSSALFFVSCAKNISFLPDLFIPKNESNPNYSI
jgi:hypothetical protein